MQKNSPVREQEDARFKGIKMVQYEFKCVKCSEINTVIIKLGHRTDNKPICCHRCGGEMSRIYHPPNVIFKGSGFTRGSGGYS
jgi:putative FmdB family regulatory protein